MKKVSLFILLFAGILFVFSCKKNAVTDNFDKTGMFTNYVDNLILPAYSEYGTALQTLESALASFNTTPDTTKFTAVQDALLDAYAAWQDCEIYEKTDPAESVQALFNTNFYPADTAAIIVNIQGNNNTSVFLQNTSFSHKGLAALDYLFFSRVNSRTQLLERFTSNPSAASYKTYAASLVSEIKRIQTNIVSGWSTYRDIFINAVGTDAGSSFSALVNTIAYRNDNLKLFQVGTPAGYIANLTTANVYPEKAQAYYSDKSIEYMLLTLENLKTVLQGKNGDGLYDYLKYLGTTSTIGGNLADDIMTQIDLCIQKASACGPDYTSTLINNKSKADELFLEVKKLTVLLKVDVPSAIGVSISYTDNDGD
jgi:predicted lipoprotein